MKVSRVVLLCLVVAASFGAIGWFVRGASRPSSIAGLQVSYLLGSGKVPNTRAILSHAGKKLIDVEYNEREVDSFIPFPPDDPIRMTYFVKSDGVKLIVSRHTTLEAARDGNTIDTVELFSTKEMPLMEQWMVMGPPKVVKRAEVVWHVE